MTTIDWIFIFLDLIGVLIIGTVFSRRMKNSQDMFVAGRNSPWWVVGISGYMTVFSAGTFVVWGGIAYRLGFVAVSILMTIGLALFLVGRFVAAKWRQSGISSPAEYLGIRFGKSAIKFYTIVGAIGRGISVAVALYAVAIIVVALIPLPEGHLFLNPETGHMSVSWAILIIGITAILYTVAGGLMAVLMIDVVQFFLLMLLVLLIIPFSLQEVGGLGTFIDKAPEGFFHLVGGEYSFIWLFLWLFLNFFLNGGDWPFVQRFISVSKPRDSKKAAYLMATLYIITPAIWMLPAMLYRIINPDANPEQAYILMSQQVLPAGLLGLMIAAMIAATSSMIDSMLNVFASVFTNDIYRPLYPQSSEKKLIRVGRIFTILYGIFIIGLAISIPYLGGAERVVVTLISLLIGPLAIPSIWGLFSRKINKRAIWLSLGITYAIGVILKFEFILHLFNYLPYGESFVAMIQSNAELTDAVVGMVIPVLILIVIELMGRKRDEDDGWKNLVGYMKQHPIEDKERGASNSTLLLTMKILVYACTFLGLAVGWIAFTSDEGRAILLLFTSLLLIGPVIYFFYVFINGLKRK
ncbi:MAG: sodium:solute symporter [Proteiniphilum sp.]|nr:sodium:solute symporter [Proteiniphilum sp.]